MKIKTLYFTIIFAILLFGACSNEEILPVADKSLSAQSISFIASMPDDGPNTRLSMEQEGKNITYKWEEDDVIQVAIVQGEIKELVVATVANISENGNKADINLQMPTQKEFDINLPVNLYGVYGGGGIDIGATDINPRAILPKKPGSRRTLADVQNEKDVMLYFKLENIYPLDPQVTSIPFEHLGSIFSITVTNTSSTVLSKLSEARITGVGGDSDWAYNSGAGGKSYDLVSEVFLDAESGGNYISFNSMDQSNNDDLQVGESKIYWGWYPPLPDKVWPKLKLKLKGATKNWTTTINSKPARKSPTAAGRAYYFNAEWDGSELSFIDKSNKELIWNKIAPFFSVPEEYIGQYGDHPSPLEFYDGRLVKDKNDWPERRAEILSKWHDKMGEWPPVITNQKFKVISSDQKDGYTKQIVQFNWTPAYRFNAVLLVPDGEGIKPAAIVPYYEYMTSIGERGENRDFALQLTKRGFITLSIGISAAHPVFYYPSVANSRIQPQSMRAYVAANAYEVLAKVQDVDPARIGIVGHSYGGKWAMFASCLYEKFAFGVWSDGGIVFDETIGDINYWDNWYLGHTPAPIRPAGKVTDKNPRTGAYADLIAEGHDLNELHALMAPRPFLVSGGSADKVKRWEALNHTIAVNRLLGFENRVAMTNRKQHTPDPESNEQLNLFFEYFLK